MASRLAGGGPPAGGAGARPPFRLFIGVHLCRGGRLKSLFDKYIRNFEFDFAIVDISHPLGHLGADPEATLNQRNSAFT